MGLFSSSSSFLFFHPRVLVVLLVTVPCTGAVVVDHVMMRGNDSDCSSWRLAVEAGNLRWWPTVPGWCVRYVGEYMVGGQYRRDVREVVDVVGRYMEGVVPADDGMDAWVLDIDETLLSNLRYYKRKHFGGEPFDKAQFDAWAKKGCCSAVPSMLGLFRNLIREGFKVFLVTGRDEESMRQPTVDNLMLQGFTGYARLIMRGPEHKGQSALAFKSAMRKQLVEEGYTIRGNIGDQWSDLSGDYAGYRTFKVPNPMYFVP